MKIGNLFLLLGAIIFTFLLIEVLLFFIYPVNDVLYNGDDYIGYKHIPNKSALVYDKEYKNKVRFNSEGFRDIEHKIKNSEEKYRIVLLGDSFVDSLQVDFNKTFHQLLAKKLEEKYPGEYEIFNFGMPAFSTAQEYLTYKYYAKKYNPQLIYLFFFINDQYDNCGEASFKPTYYIENGEIKQRPFEPKKRNKLEFFVSDHFKTIVFLRNEYYSMIKKLESKKSKKTGSDFEKVFLKNSSEKTEECWNITAYFFRLLKKEAEKSNLQLKVFIIPHPASIYNDSRKKFLKEETALDESYFDFQKPYREIKTILEKEDIEYMDLRNLFKDKERAYYFLDGHFNEYGHEILSEELLKDVKNGR